MKKLIIFNWKMNPTSLKEVKRLFNLILNHKSYILNPKKIELVIAPPFIYLSNLKLKITAFAKSSAGKQNLKLAAQNVFCKNSGAYTGEISSTMLKNLGVEYVIIGHSERRKYLGETDEMINKKVLAGLCAGLKVVLCVGEDLSIRKRGLKAVKNFIKKQLEKDLKGIGNWKLEIRNLIVAYEPIWAIGTGNPCHPEDALEMIKFIKQILKAKSYKLKPKVLYGGSVDSKNIESFVKYKEIDGALVGGASLKTEEVKKIIKIMK